MNTSYIPGPDVSIQVDSVSKFFGSPHKSSSVHALDDVSLTVTKGEVFGLLGPNGAGKTTLVKILLGLVTQSSGNASIRGIDTRKFEARKPIGFLAENHRFPGFLTGAQLLMYYGQLSGVDRSYIKKRIPVLLDQVNMAKWANTRIKKYSKGMMQRLGLAQALINDPDVVFLDEPTDGVDPVGRLEIRRILNWLGDQGTTVFLNSHLLSEVEQVCDRVAILNNGAVLAEGSISDLTKTTTGTYTISVAGSANIPQSLQTVLGEIQDRSSSGIVRFNPAISDRESLNQLIDSLRAHAVPIESISRVRRSLEDSFIDLLDSPVD
ncbi:MAG: ABC transporter ATP-binding protein [Rhodothermales bacterium]|nr:ABC transporter ATP-binding protein [Rhodothermales bacterium]